ncbi:MAG: hypothetical protein AAFZ09_18650 [Pseudomonadota bacterium]
MSQDDLPTSVEELHRLLTEARQRTAVAEERTAVAEQQSVELAATIEKQNRKLDQFELKIRELLKALRGKQRERIDPSQLMLFDIGELEDAPVEELPPVAGDAPVEEAAAQA